MIKNIKIKETELVVGTTLDWDVFDRNGNLLLSKGYVINSEKQSKTLIGRVLYRQIKTNNELPDTAELETVENPFELFYMYCNRLLNLLDGLTQHSEKFPDQIDKFCDELQSSCEKHSDALMGAVHLCYDFSYTIFHPLHIAILSEVVGLRLKMDKAQRMSLLKAALTCNIEMRSIQDELQSQKEKLSNTQKEIIDLHSENAVKFLTEIGITDQVWLNAVLQHHERPDGTGYPNGLMSTEICDEAKLIGMLERYTAMITNRRYRETIHARYILKYVFLNKGKEFDEGMSLALIKEMGIYPPGTFVRLKNDEIAVVTKRGKDSVQPVVCSILNPIGERLPYSIRIDCTMDELYEIEQTAQYDNPIKLDLGNIWGYI
jgi:HD-GYP domain-containing protein (c-di-GMP phosphodiesterase class II)